MLVLSASASARPPTRGEARSLVPDALGRLVLGAGADIVAVDRPQWRAHCGGPLCPPINPDRLRRLGPPPISEGIGFYERARLVAGGAHSTGLCATRVTRIYYTEHGAPNGSYITRRYGFPPALARSPRTTPNDRGWTGPDMACAAVRELAGFFEAADDTGATRAVLASRQIDAVSHMRALPFVFTCEIFSPGSQTRCAGPDGLRRIAPKLKIEAFSDVRPVPCRAAVAHRACYEIANRDPGETATVEMTDDGEARMIQLAYRRADVVY